MRSGRTRPLTFIDTDYFSRTSIAQEEGIANLASKIAAASLLRDRAPAAAVTCVHMPRNSDLVSAIKIYSYHTFLFRYACVPGAAQRGLSSILLRLDF